MAAKAIRLCADKCWPTALPGALDGRARGLTDRKHVVTVDAHAWHTVPGRALDDVRHGGCLTPVVELGKPVVLAYEDNWQPQYASQVQRLVERALVTRSVSKERHR